MLGGDRGGILNIIINKLLLFVLLLKAQIMCFTGGVNQYISCHLG